MPRSRIRTKLPLLAIAVSVVLLVVAGMFLYRWVDRLTDLDRQRRQEDLDASMINLQREFAATLHEVVWFFHPLPELHSRSPEAVYSELYSQWKNTARWPQLINRVSIAFRSESSGRIVLAQFLPKSGTFVKQPWPTPLEAFRNSLSDGTRSQALASGLAPRAVDYLPLAGGVLLNGGFALALPILSIRSANSGPVVSFRFRAERAEELTPPPPGPYPRGLGPFPSRDFVYVARTLGNSRLAGWCFLQFNLSFIQTQLLPFLVSQYFGRTGLAKYHVAVIMGNPQQLVYASEPALTAKTFSASDAKITLFSPHIRFGAGAAVRTQLGEPRAGADARRRLTPPSMILERMAKRAGHDPDAWQLVARDRAGSLAAEVASARRRNLAIGFGTLLLLACSIAAMVVGTYRAHSLATRQMEFVAGISHELRTPLTVIESAGFNLAKGRVDDLRRVQQYGEVIQTEGRRLSDLVEQTLAYSGVQAGRQRYEFKPTRVLDVVDEALGEYDPLFNKMGWHVEKVIETSLPLVSADAAVLKSVIKNVIGNALKYAPEGRWLRVRARAVESWRGTEVQIAIADHGPGIAAEDLPHIFEPFYRGHQVVASPVTGAGLGLSLVNGHMQAHSGRVSVRTNNGSGTEFALHLPSL